MLIPYRLFVLSLLLVVPVASSFAQNPPLRWWKGNLHTHSLWSDGDEFPEMIADWYRENGYHFLALSDHNVLSEGERWIPVKEAVRRADEGILQRYLDRFGDAWVQTRGEPEAENHQVRLKPLNEFRCLLEERDRFIMIAGEEISDRSEGKPVHINATNLAEVIPPAGGATVREAMQNNLRAILEHEKQHGREILPHLNHPNFGYAVTPEDLAAVLAERFFEVYNGHPSVNHLGDEEHPGVERIWDLVNAIRCGQAGAPPIMGIATDDSHEYHGRPGSRPGRGWVMVRSRFLTPEHLIQALKRGDFYASSGVTLREVHFDTQRNTLSIEVAPDDGATYTTEFIATLKHHDASHDGSGDGDAGDGDSDHDEASHLHDELIGKVVATAEGTHASYQLTGDELYVRAVVTSDQPHRDPSFEGQRQQAWTQPVVPVNASE